MTCRLDGVAGLVFDLDGTLVESYSAHIKSWSRAVAFFGVEADEQMIRPHLGRSSGDIARALLGNRPRSEIEDAYRLKDQIYYEIIPQELRPVDGAVVTLMDLRRRGYRISIASSNPATVITRSLRTVGLDVATDHIASQDEVNRGKPEPDLFLLAAKKMGLSPSMCVAIGDTTYDVLAGRAAGMPTIAYCGRVQPRSDLVEARPGHLISDLRELLDLLPGPGPANPDGPG